MRRRNSAKALALLLACTTVSAFALFTSVKALEEWKPALPPDPSQVELTYLRENGVSYVNVTIAFGSSGYNVTDWGMPNLAGNSVSANAEIWYWTGYVLPAITYKHHTYDLGNLAPGDYLFTFEVWRTPVKNVTFTVPPTPSPVGGNSIEVSNTNPVTLYFAMVAILTVCITTVFKHWNTKTKARKKC